MMSYLQKLGKSLLLPMALLPIVLLFIIMGYLFNSNNSISAFFSIVGNGLLDNIGILFALAVSIGLPKKKDPSSALSGLAAFLIITTILSAGTVALLTSTPVEEVAPAFSHINNFFIGIIAGIIGAISFDKFHMVELPDALAFFSGKRLAPIMSTLFALITSFILFFVWPVLFNIFSSILWFL